jgi:hypothetical protein
MSEKTMLDAMGNDVPIRYVSHYDRARDVGVRRIHTRWVKARSFLERVMADSLADLERIAAARGEAGIEVAEKGNLQVSSFDGMLTVGLVVRYEIHLDERVVRARELMLDYARGLASKLGGDDAQALLALIDEAFQASRSGALSVSRVLSLMRRDIRAPQWQEAKRLLSESMETRRGKSYLRVESRPDRQHDPTPIRLDIADCWPAQETPNDEVPS